MNYDYANVDIRDRGNLPHWNVEGGLYFTTFRLRDAVPMRVMEQLLKRRKKLLYDAAFQTDVAVKERLEGEARREYHAAVEKALDQNLGSCILARPDAAQIMVSALKHFDAQRYDLLDWSVMPNHVHSVFRAAPDFAIDELMKSWKGYSAARSTSCSCGKETCGRRSTSM